MKNLNKIFPVLLIAVYAACGSDSRKVDKVCGARIGDHAETKIEWNTNFMFTSTYMHDPNARS